MEYAIIEVEYRKAALGGKSREKQGFFVSSGHFCHFFHRVCSSHWWLWREYIFVFPDTTALDSGAHQ